MDEKQISELLECSVCLERFDQTCKVLPCQHTFCRRCLDEIVLTKHELRCPECRALVTVRVADLPTNILVVRILEGLKTKGYHPPGGGGRLHHGAINLTSSPSKLGGSNPLHRHDAGSAHHFRQGTQPCARALYNYEPAEKEDLPFKKGDIILLRRQIDENWYQGDHAGRQGFFPANFVQVLVPLPQIPQCRALYDFELNDENEKDCLSFKKDEVLTVIRRVDENWLEGRKGDKIGIFPITFVELNDAARSLINTKSNLTILPSSSASPSSSSSSSAPSSSSSSLTATGTTSSANSNRNAAGSNGSSTSSGVTLSSSSSTSSTAAIVEESLVVSTSQASSSEPLVVSTSDSQAEATVTTTSTATTNASSSSSSPSTAIDMASPTSSSSPDVLPQNKRHSYTSPSLSTSPTAASATGGHSQQRHSAEVTLTSGGNLTLVNSEVTTVTASSSSSSLPSSSASAETQLTTSSSPRNTPASATAPEVDTESLSSTATSSSNVQSGSLTVPLYIALYNYKPQKDDELELYKDEHYTVSEKCLDGWFKGTCMRTCQAGVFPGNYVRMVRHPSAFKPVNPNVLNIRAKAPVTSPPAAPSLNATSCDQRPAQAAAEPPTQAPPLMPRVARMTSVPGPKSRSPSSQLTGTPHRSFSGTGTASISTSPKHVFSSPLSAVSSSSSHVSVHTGLSRSTIPAPPPSTTSSPHHSLWVPPNLVAMQQSMSASANITPPNVVMAQNLDSPAAALVPSGKDKKEKKEKEKKGLVKLLSGKSKKSKPVLPDPEPTPPLAVLCFDNVAHVRSGSFPANGTAFGSLGAGGDASVTSAHRKAASFDATTTPPVPAKPRPKPMIRERYCCIVPYPPQTEHELALELGDIIHVHRKREDGWYKGTQERTGKTGMFPASFVEKCD